MRTVWVVGAHRVGSWSGIAAFPPMDFGGTAVRNFLFARLLRGSSAQEVRAAKPQRKLLSFVAWCFPEAEARGSEGIQYENSQNQLNQLLPSRRLG